MLTKEELQEVKEYVLIHLPRILEEDPKFVYFVEGIVSEKFPRKDEFSRLLDAFIKESEERRAENKKIKEDMHSEISLLRTEMNHRFAQVDQRFDQVDQRFDKVEQHLEKVDQRLDKVEQHLEKVDQRFDKVEQHLEKVDQRLEKVEERLDNMDHRFEGVDQRLNTIEQRFDAMEQRFDAMEQRFDAMEQRFDVMENRLNGMEQRLTGISQEMKDLRDWCEMITGRLQTRVGRRIEEVCAGALRLGLNRPDVRPENILLRKKIKDQNGDVFKPGKEKEVDIWVNDGELLVFEAKSSPDAEDVDDFADKVELVRIQNPDKIVKGVFIAVGVEEDVRAQCRKRNIQLIPDRQYE